MPTYHARGISARLGTLPLSDAITRNVVAKKGEVARQQGEAAEKKLRKSKLLTEQSVPFPGDDSALELNWIGNAPFMQTEIAPTSLASAEATRRHGRKDNDSSYKSEALVLHVQLSDKTFISGLNKAKTNLKIDVFFNGELASCVFIPIHDVRSGVKPLHQVLAGTRVDYLSERPWVIVRTGLTSGDGGRDHAVVLPVEPRWGDICQALQREAHARGMDDKGNTPPSAEFLRALATMQMPRQVHDMQRPGGLHFGVIDVIISAGDGRKTASSAGYLKTAQRLMDNNFPLNTENMDENKQAPNLTVRDSALNTTDQTPNDMDAVAACESDCEPCPKKRAMTPRALALDEVSTASKPFLSQIPSLLPQAGDSTVKSPSSDVQTKYRQDSSPPADNLGPIRRFKSFQRCYTGHTIPNITTQRQEQSATEFRIQSRSAQSDFAVSDPGFAHNLHSSLWSSWGNGPVLQHPSYPHPGEAKVFLDGHHSSPLQHIGPSFDKQPQLLSSSPSVLSGHGINEHDDRCAYPVYTMSDDYERHDSSALSNSGLPPSDKVQFQPRRKNHTVAPLGPKYPWSVLVRPQPHTSHSISLYRHTLAGRSPVPVPNFPQPFPLQPPIGAYTVPQKPKTSPGVSKAKGVGRSTKSSQSLWVTRLVVYGRSVPILDHRWIIPQRLSRDFRGLPSEENTSQPGEPSSTSTQQTSTNAVTGGPDARHLDVADSVGTNHVLGPRSYSLRHAVSESCTSGTQDPKAAMLLLDDPEELLRGPSRLRRSRAPVKLFDQSTNPPNLKADRATRDLALAETTTSSPLSSAPTTPEPMDCAAFTKPIKAASQSVQTCKPCVSQADIPCESPATPTVIPSSKISPLSEDLQQVACLETTPTKTPYLLNSKKRKTANQSTAMKWRIHERIIDVNDSLLNENCVITYADIESGGENSAPLRQVKSERQGVFQEEYVVFAARFFVPGN